MASRRVTGARAWLLVRADGRSTAVAGVADRSAAPGPAELSRRNANAEDQWGVESGVETVEPSRRCDVVHDLAGKPRHCVVALQRAAGHRSRKSDSRTQSSGDRRLDRVLREHTRAAY